MQRMAYTLLAGVLVIAGAVSAGAAATDRQGGPSKQRSGNYLKRLDADNDGAVTLEEYLRRRTTRFTRSDKGGDGVLDQPELTEGVAARLERQSERLFRRLDKDSDGKLTKAEFERGPSGSQRPDRFAGPRSLERQQRQFAYMGRNGDGTVDKTEAQAARAEEQDYQTRRALHLLDRNADGKVSFDEYTADARARFVRLDLDGDGRITAPDLPPAARRPWTN